MKPNSVLSLLLVLGLFAFIGCTSPEQNNTPAAPAFDIEKAKGYIMNEYPAKFGDAFAKGDAAGVVALYTSDAVMLPPNSESAAGTQNMEATVSSYMKMGAKGIKLTPAEVMGGADGIFASGSYQLSDSSGNVIDQGKYCEFWNEENGTWKVHRDIWNSNMPLPQPAP